MSYYIDLSQISLQQYDDKLQNSYLPPSRKILRDNSLEQLSKFECCGINNLAELLKYLNNAKNFEKLLNAKPFDKEYLIILKRELNSLLPKPNKLKDIKDIPENTLNMLEQSGIKTTLHLFELIKTKDKRPELSKKFSISDDQVMLLAKYCDLSRIKWVSIAFAKMLLDSGIDSALKVSNANAEELHKSLLQINAAHKYFKGNIGLNDIHAFVEAAGDVPNSIEF